MSVVEYLHKFTELSRYEPDAVKTDEKKQVPSFVVLAPISSPLWVHLSM
jgi:hypothetical protein